MKDVKITDLEKGAFIENITRSSIAQHNFHHVLLNGENAGIGIYVDASPTPETAILNNNGIPLHVDELTGENPVDITAKSGLEEMFGKLYLSNKQ